MHPSALEKSGFTTTLNMALSSTAPERSAETIHRKQLARFGKWLYRLGFVPGTAGNLSVRLGPDRILATPTAMSKGPAQGVGYGRGRYGRPPGRRRP